MKFSHFWLQLGTHRLFDVPISIIRSTSGFFFKLGLWHKFTTKYKIWWFSKSGDSKINLQKKHVTLAQYLQRPTWRARCSDQLLWICFRGFVSQKQLSICTFLFFVSIYSTVIHLRPTYIAADADRCEQARSKAHKARMRLERVACEKRGKRGT